MSIIFGIYIDNGNTSIPKWSVITSWILAIIIPVISFKITCENKNLKKLIKFYPIFKKIVAIISILCIIAFFLNVFLKNKFLGSYSYLILLGLFFIDFVGDEFLNC